MEGMGYVFPIDHNFKCSGPPPTPLMEKAEKVYNLVFALICRIYRAEPALRSSFSLYITLYGPKENETLIQSFSYLKHYPFMQPNFLWSIGDYFNGMLSYLDRTNG